MKNRRVESQGRQSGDAMKRSARKQGAGKQRARKQRARKQGTGIRAALLVVAIGVAFWVAAKIFRIGVLMTGKPPRLGEILRWLRAPVGSVPTRPE